MTERERIDALEFKVAHLERASQELSDVLYRQQREIDALRLLHRELQQQVEDFATRAADPTRVEIPPHY